MVKTIFIEEYVQTILYHGPHHSFHPDTYPDFLIIIVHYESGDDTPERRK